MKNRIRTVLAILAAALLAAACQAPATPKSGGKASLTINVSNQINARTLAPGLDMNPASYTVTGTGPSGATFKATTSGGAVTKNNLAFGSWTVAVNATNAGGTLIGTGSATTQVNTASTSTVSVTVTPVSGVGTLNLNVSWPNGSVQTPSIDSTLTPALGSAQTLPFNISGSSASYTNSSVGNGYYTLALTVKDTGVLVAGAVDVVRIVTGQTTGGTYAFTQVNAPGGTIQVNVDANMQNPLDVAISGASANQTVGTTKTLTASVSNYSGNVVYVWYVNGVSAATGSTFEFNSGSVAGYSYRIDVTAFSADGTRGGSATTNVGAVVAPSLSLIGQGTPLSLAGTVTTIAGSKAQGNNSADGVGTSAYFNSPIGITTDGQNLYVVQSTKIRKIVVASGVVTTLAGSDSEGYVDGVGAAARFDGLAAITTDGVNLYVSDEPNHAIRKVVISTGEVTTLAGTTAHGNSDGVGSNASFYNPAGITTDGTRLFVCDFSNNSIRQIVIATGVVTTLVSGSAGILNGPVGITTDGTNLFVCDCLNNRIYEIQIASGAIQTLAGSLNPGSSDGTGSAASFSYPFGITTDGTNLYVTEQLNNLVRKIVISTAVVTTIAGSVSGGNVDGTGTAARFDHPAGVTTEGTSLYVTDLGNAEIRAIR